MPSISHLTLPSGNTYELKDAYARQLLAGGLNFVICWDGASEPVIANIPAGVKVTYNGVEYTGTKAASTAEPLTFYLVYSPTQEDDHDVYDEYAAIGPEGSKTWEKLGDTRIDLSDLGELAYKDNVSLNKGSGADVLGANATFAVGGGSKTKVKLKATASGAAVSTQKAAFVQSYPGAKSKLAKGSVAGVKTNTEKSIPNVTSVGQAPDWDFQMGTGADAETLIISGGNGSAPTLGAPIAASLIETESKDFATGALDPNGAGAEVMTDLGTAQTGQAVTDASVSAQPAIAIAEDANGDVEVMKDIDPVTVQTDNKDSKKVALYGDLGVTVS